jgi:hypothetical protein
VGASRRLFGLAPAGFTVPPALPPARWALTPPFHPYPIVCGTGGLFSVALSVTATTPCPGVIWRFAHGARTFLGNESSRSIPATARLYHYCNIDTPAALMELPWTARSAEHCTRNSGKVDSLKLPKACLLNLGGTCKGRDPRRALCRVGPRVVTTV